MAAKKVKMRLQGHKLSLMEGGRGQVAYSGEAKQRFSTIKDSLPRLVVGEIDHVSYGAQTRSKFPFLKKITSIKKFEKE